VEKINLIIGKLDHYLSKWPVRLSWKSAVSFSLFLSIT